jgi:hypothetical protein
MVHRRSVRVCVATVGSRLVRRCSVCVFCHRFDCRRLFDHVLVGYHHALIGYLPP